MKKNVLITGIGGNTAQGILRNIDALNYNVKKIGTNIERVSSGNYLCDRVYEVPYAYNEKEYIKSITLICKKEKIDLIIPSTDYEVYYLSLHKDELPSMPCPKPEINKIFLDKFLTWSFFSRNGIPFAKTKLPSMYKNDFSNYEIIVKPREGRGSREILINPKKINFSDSYVIQKLEKGIEITTSFYVTRAGFLLGFITFERELSFGTTIKCSVTKNYDKQLSGIIDKMLANFEIKGSCNIQSIVNKKGNIIPFEINGRISGTNSIRSQFGFNDIKFILDEYLYNITPKKPIIKKGSAIRVISDIIYPNIGLSKIKNKYTKHYQF